MSKLDPRLNAYRADLAASALRGRVEAGRFVDGEAAQVCRGLADLRRGPEANAPLDSQLLFGEPVVLYDCVDGWAWVQSQQDGYVGYVTADVLSGPFTTATHSVGVLRSFIYPAPDLKSRPLDCLTMGSGVEVRREQGAFSEIVLGPGRAGWVYSAHLAGRKASAPDYTATALQFLGVPYLWGGRSSLGLDCSALVQIALGRAGIACQRDSDMQAASLGTKVAEGISNYRPTYGDILYMPEHVAIAVDEVQVVHANAHHMLVATEPLRDLLARVAQESGRPSDQTLDVVRRPAQCA